MSATSKPWSLTISIPAYNDSQSLILLVEDCELILGKLNIPFTILIVDDGSNDDTLSVAQRMALKYGNIQVLHHEKNKGFGETLKKVFMLPSTDWVLFLPGDNQFAVTNIYRFLTVMNDYDFILGYRKKRSDTMERRLLSLIYNHCVSLFSGYKVKDVNSIVFFRSHIFKKIDLTGNSAFVHAEFFIKTIEAGFRVTEVEIEHKHREFGFGSGGNWRVIASTLAELFFYFANKYTR